MICPYCNEEMKVGEMLPVWPKFSNELFWLPEGCKIKGIHYTREKLIQMGAIVFGRDDVFQIHGNTAISTYHCPNCNILLTKLKP